MRKFFSCFVLVMSVWLALAPLAAAEEVRAGKDYDPFDYELKDEEIDGIDGPRHSADEWFFGPEDDKRAGSQKKSDSEGERYLWIFTAGDFDYYLDTKSARWILRPYSASEYILDVWVRAMPNTQSEEYSDSPKYYMEHYYLRPRTKQIQFLCEMEVTGHPENTVPQREYSIRNWENLIPESVEENVYTSVMKNARKIQKKPGMRFADFVDEYFRIGLN